MKNKGTDVDRSFAHEAHNDADRQDVVLSDAELEQVTGGRSDYAFARSGGATVAQAAYYQLFGWL